MKIAFVGCGYVFDIYMRTKWAHPELDVCGVFDIDRKRMEVVSKHYNYRAYQSFDELLSDPSIEIVVNLTSVHSHYEVTKAALLAGKHVYSEKPLTTDTDETRELFLLAEKLGRIFTGAPSNIFSDAVSTMWKAVLDGAIGKPVLVYAELDDNPAHLMKLEKKQSPTGAPFPYAEEFQEGCTFEHIGYHLVWLCAMFGPATSVTAFSKLLIEHKTDTPLNPADTPDLSVACLNFANGVAARITCTWVAPRDHRYRIIGDEGEINADNVMHYQAPIYLERFSPVSLGMRKIYSLRSIAWLGRLFGIGGRRVPLLRRWKSHAVESEKGVGRSIKHKFVSWLRRREIYAQDKLIGVAEMVLALNEGRPQPLSPDFLMHINELTLLIQRAGSEGIAVRPTTTFSTLSPFPDVRDNRRNYRVEYKPRLAERFMAGVIERLNKS